MVGWIVLAVVILPFVLGDWVGHPWFAGAAFGALALTVLLEASGTDSGAPEGFAAGMALGLVVSAASAAAGGWVRARQRRAAEARRDPTDRR
jgi:hypothetical protein